MKPQMIGPSMFNYKLSVGKKDSDKSADLKTAIKTLGDDAFPKNSQHIPPNGEFAPKYVDMNCPITGTHVKNVRLQLEPSNLDKSVRKLMLITTMDDDRTCTRMVTKGNNFALESVFQNPRQLQNIVKELINKSINALGRS